MKYKMKRGEPIRFTVNGEELMGIFHSQKQEIIKVILINNSFDKQEIIEIHKSQKL